MSPHTHGGTSQPDVSVHLPDSSVARHVKVQAACGPARTSRKGMSGRTGITSPPPQSCHVDHHLLLDHCDRFTGIEAAQSSAPVGHSLIEMAHMLRILVFRIRSLSWSRAANTAVKCMLAPLSADHQIALKYTQSHFNAALPRSIASHDHWKHEDSHMTPILSSSRVNRQALFSRIS